MQAIVTNLSNNIRYFYHDYWKSKNEIVDRMPLMSGPWSILLITFGYIWFSTVSGPKWMKSRKAFDLRPLLFCYNLIMVLLNGFIFYKAAIFTNFGIYPWTTCNNSLEWGTDQVNDEQIAEMLQLSWLFFFSKFLDFLDTVFFVLRKKDQQLSRLHLIHHSLMPICTYFGLKFWTNMSAGFVPFLNSFVHTIMYLYYALSALKIHVWWKKWLTKLQMGQLLLVIVHSIYFSMFSSCDHLYPSYFAYTIAFLSFMLFALFGNFFYQSYIKNSSYVNVSNSLKSVQKNDSYDKKRNLLFTNLALPIVEKKEI